MLDSTSTAFRYSMASPPKPRPKPVKISRGDVYCDKDFWGRSAAWIVSQQEQLRAQQQKAKVTKKTNTHRWASTATPTRVQPARAAKRKKRYAEDMDSDGDGETVSAAQSKRPKRAKTTKVDTDTPCGDYLLDPAYATTSLPSFQSALDTLLEGKRATLARRCFWSTSLSIAPPSSVSNQWCPIVAMPLSCTDNIVCAHGMSNALPQAHLPLVAPIAIMSPPDTPPADAVQFQAKPFAEQRHVEERTASLAGLRFAVDMCNGMLRVYMV
jgi:hypothetical protein